MWWFSVALAGDPAPAPASPVVVSGTLTLDAARAADLSRAIALFISVRDPAGGPPLAALKLVPGPFPMTFSVTEANAIAMGGAPRPFPATVDVSVRLDADGDPLTKDDGLPVAALPGTKKGSTALSVLLK
jgi:cytochrome c-type biogenesis protein CcmH